MHTLTMPTLDIEVTQADIDSGIQNHPDCCPVANALKRKGYSSISVYVNRSSFYDPSIDCFFYCENSDSLSHFIRNFDKHRSVEPDNFTLYIA